MDLKRGSQSGSALRSTPAGVVSLVVVVLPLLLLLIMLSMFAVEMYLEVEISALERLEQLGAMEGGSELEVVLDLESKSNETALPKPRLAPLELGQPEGSDRDRDFVAVRLVGVAVAFGAGANSRQERGVPPSI